MHTYNDVINTVMHLYLYIFLFLLLMYGLVTCMLSTLNIFLQQSSQKPTLTNDTKDKEYKPHDLPQRQSVQPAGTCTIARRAKRTKVKDRYRNLIHTWTR